jgi:mRNA degradation ribonuclease J1/J2
MWSGYLEKPSIRSFLEGFACQPLHTSGHATPEALQKVCTLTSPRRGVVPIHTEHPELFQEILPDAKVAPLSDGQSIDLGTELVLAELAILG